MKKLICLLLRHQYLATVYGTHVTIKCKRCGDIEGIDFDGPQRYVKDWFQLALDDAMEKVFHNA